MMLICRNGPGLTFLSHRPFQSPPLDDINSVLENAGITVPDLGRMFDVGRGIANELFINSGEDNLVISYLCCHAIDNGGIPCLFLTKEIIDLKFITQ